MTRNQYMTSRTARPSTFRSPLSYLDLDHPFVLARARPLGRPWLIGFDGHTERRYTNSK